MIKRTLLAAVLVGMFGCNKPAPEVAEPAVEEPVVEETPAVAEVVAEPEITAEELPVPDDFADEVAESITDENLEDELAKLEKEMEAEGDEG